MALTMNELETHGLRIAIDAQIIDTSMGGVSSHLAALVKALGELDGPERYFVVCAKENPDWLRAYVGRNQSIVMGPDRRDRQLVKRLFGRQWRRVWAAGYALASKTLTRIPATGRTPLGAVTDMSGYFERLGARVVHEFSQVYLRTRTPVIFNPHDLQHEHFPHFFTPEALAKRRAIYRAACEQAAVVVAASQFTRDDVIRQYGLAQDKIVVIPLAPATVVHRAQPAEFVSDIRRKYDLSRPFVLYPAATWEHKNHLGLLKAVAALRDGGLRVDLVCTGRRLEPAWSALTAFTREAKLSDLVHFLDFVSGEDLRALYAASEFVVAPSLFEQASGPMFEAWQEGKAVASSDVTSIPDQAGGAALLFDPTSVDAIAMVIREMWVDRTLRERFERLGRARLGEFTWDKTAKAYRALYRCVGRAPLTDEDRALLRVDWMSNKENPRVC